MDDTYFSNGYKYEYPLVLFEAVVWFSKNFDAKYRCKNGAEHIKAMIGDVTQLIPYDVQIRSRITDTLLQTYPAVEMEFMQSIPLGMAND